MKSPGREKAILGKPFWIAVGLVLLNLIVYAQVRHFAFVNFDDPDHVSANAPVLAGLTWRSVVWALTTDHMAFWMPLTWLSFMLDVQLQGIQPGGFHVTNVALHLTNTVLLFWVLERLTGAMWPSACVAALFGIHPLHVESVAWISERKDVLSTLFWWLTIAAYLGWVRRPTWGRYGLALALFALGLAAKSMLVTVPCVLLLLDYWPLGRADRTSWRALVREKLPFFALSAAAGLASVLAQRHIGALSDLNQLPVWVRTAHACVSYATYLGQALWPTHLAVFYPYLHAPTLLSVAGALVVIAGVSLAVANASGNRPWLLVGWLWYLGTLVPVIGLMQVGDFSAADRFTYVPLTGLFIMAAWDTPQRLRGWRAPRWVAPLTAGSAIAACTVLAWNQASYWANSRVLWQHALAVTDDNFRAHIGLGDDASDRGDTSEAIAHYAGAVRLVAASVEAHRGLGLAFMREDRVGEAARELEAAVRLDPGDAVVHTNLGAMLARQGRLDDAISHYTAAIRLRPDYALAHDNLGLALATQGKLDDGIRECLLAIRLDGSRGDWHHHVGVMLAGQGRTAEAVAHLETALAINPSNDAARQTLNALK